LGESVIGTVASLAAVVEHQGWTLEAVLVGVAGTGLTFGMWWTYFIIPSAGILQGLRRIWLRVRSETRVPLGRGRLAS
jgi:Bacterial low temperature requirement A protein (LtrA)